MKKIFQYPFLCLLVASAALASPFVWREIGLLPAPTEQVQPGDDQLSAPPLDLTTEAPSADAFAPMPTEPVTQPPTQPPTEAPTQPPTEPPTEAPTQPVPLPPEAPFLNALFVGDSRTVGLGQYAGIREADFFATTGMSVYTLFEKESEMPQRDPLLLEVLLQEKAYDRIYVMLGINELGYNFDHTVTTYGEVVARLRELQPDAYIHIQANLHVTKNKSDSDDLYNNTNIDRLNDALAGLADGKRVFFMDVNPVFDDEFGCLQGDLTGDGVHLYAKHYKAWAEWLQANTPA